MIQYSSSDWFGLIFSCTGTVWPSIRPKFVAVSLYAVLCYIIADTAQLNFGTEGRTILFASVAMLLIFRANQAFVRYWQGRTLLGDYFTASRELVLLSMDYIRGGVRTSVFTFSGQGSLAEHFPPDRFDDRALELRVDIVRLSLAAAVALRLHTHIASEGYVFGVIDRDAKWHVDWERFRLRQLLTEQEFRLVDACVGLRDDHGAQGGGADPLRPLAELFAAASAPPEHWPECFAVDRAAHPRPCAALLHLLRQLIVTHMNGADNQQPWGIKERFVSELLGALSKMQQHFDAIDQIISTPLPLPYANLCKTCLAVFLATLPFFVDYRLGWFANTVIPVVVTLALMGIDAIATELENPFGVDANDLDVLEKLHQLEREGMELLRLSGPHDATSRFCWRAIPGFVAEMCSRQLHHYLAVRALSPGLAELAAEPGLALEPWADKRLRTKG